MESPKRMDGVSMGFRDRLAGAVRVLRGDSAPVPTPAPSPQPSTRRDAGWTNTQTGMGGYQDRSQYTGFSRRSPMGRELCDALYQGDALSAKGIDLPVVDCLANGWEIQSTSCEPETLAALDAEVKVQGLAPLLYEALTWERLYGGSAICLNFDDGLPPAMPLGPIAFPLKSMFPIHRWETWPASFGADPNSPTFGEALTWRVRRDTCGGVAAPSVEWHRSRMLVFSGRPLPKSARAFNWGWGDSEFDRVWDAIKRTGTSSSAVTTLLEEFSQVVIHLPGIKEVVAMSGASAIRERLASLRMSMGLMRAVILDEGEQLSRVSGGTGGIAEILGVQREELAAAWDIPLRRLYGLMPAGLAVSGDTDLKFYYGMISSIMQEQRLRPNLEMFYQVLFALPAWKTGPNPFGGKAPDDWKLVFKPLSTMLPTEEAAVRASFLTSLSAGVTAGIMDPVADARPALKARYPDMITETDEGEDPGDVDPLVDTRPPPEVVAAAGDGYQLYLSSDRSTPAWVVQQSRMLRARTAIDYGRLGGLASWYRANEVKATSGDPAAALGWAMLAGNAGRDWVNATILALDIDADGVPNTGEGPEEGEDEEA